MTLEIKNITKAFEEKTIFRDFSYIFQDKGIYAVAGPSGIGKTTLLRMIAGLDKNFSGQITGGGADNVSYCFQEHRLFPTLTALDNVLKVSFKEETAHNRSVSVELLKRLKFTDSDMKLFPSEMSGGMRQRIAFARSVLKKSSILLLDEATKELDAELTEIVLQIIREQSENRLVIIVTHKAEELDALGAKIIEI